MAKGFKYTKEDVLREMAEVLTEAEASGPGAATAKPNVLEILKAKGGLNKVRNERI